MMTATTVGTGTCLAAKGLDISLAALKRQDPYINNIVDVASQVALYTFSNRANEWEKTDVEGTLFVYTRLASPRHGFTIMNRLSMDNLTEPITKDLDFQLQDPFLLYRNARLSIYGIWFYDKEDCRRIAELMKNMTRQEQLLAQRGEDVSPLRAEDKGVDILQMLTKARNEYDKGKPCSEPKEIASSSVLCDNPHLIKPIPVKPLERAHMAPHSLQDSDGERRQLSLAALFGVQSQPKHLSPQAGSGGGRPPGPRPAVARSLSYEEPARPGPGPGMGVGVPGSGSPPQHCPAIQKLMSSQRAPAELLQPVSESPENRLCENGGLPPAHRCQASDPLHRLFQNAPVAPTCCAHPPPPLQQPPLLGGAPHHHPASKPLFYSPSKPQLAPMHPQLAPMPPQLAPMSPQLAPMSPQLAPMPPQLPPMPPQLPLPPQLAAPAPLPPQLTGVVSPHELLQRLQLVQQEQSLSSEQVRPGLAPRFQEPLPQPHPQSLPARPLDGWADKPSGPGAAEKPKPLFQGISPQRGPVTVSPTVLMSPMVFSQSKLAKGGIDCVPTAAPALAPQAPPDPRTLTKSQLQATLLHLIQTDAAFLDTIYNAYISSISKDTVTKNL
ncbi:mRNA-decapping enzyme 1B [Conger conger]|uniref:mRNA-decapping enzyme 1B n=1 Tax=Conger conger TaxID=82655 RepID=UPI002A5A6B30|nr:mRNA-decapping enzyme 1B [Conger conger]